MSNLFGARWSFRRLMLVVALGAFGVAGAILASKIWGQSHLNVILVTFDTTRADRIGAYGYQNGLTAALDEFAKRGVVFERASAPVPLTLPSHTSMLTGLYPPEHGLRVNGSGRLSNDIPLLPEILKKAGYQTAAFVSAFVLDSKFGLNRGFDTYDDDLSGTAVAAHSVDRRREGKSIVDAAIRWMQRQTHSQPFFCWVHFYDAHGEYDPRPDLFGDRFKEQPYDAGIAIEVQQFDRLISHLREQKLDERTVVIVAGDHGEGLGDHTEDEHGLMLYNTTLHVPLMIAGPALCKPGHRVPSQVSLVDLTPTILDLLKIPSPRHTSGRSLKSALSGGEIDSIPYYAETEAPFLDNRWSPLRAVISGKWKYIFTTRKELYNTEIDPEEVVNLIDTNGDQAKEMQNILEVLQDGFRVSTSSNVALSEKDLETLRSLGYVAGNKVAPQAEGEVLPDIKEMLPFSRQIQKASHLFADGDIEATIALTKEVLAETDRFPMAEILLGDAYRQQGKLDEAEASYQKVLAKQPDNGRAHAHLAVVYVKRGQFEKAAGEFREVIKMDSEAGQAHLDLAQTLTRLDKYPEAVKEYRQAIRSDPGFVMAHFQLGIVLGRMNQLKEAAESFGLAIKYDPNLVVGYSNLANVQVLLGQYDLAMKSAGKAIELAPESYDAHLMLGLALKGLKRYVEAINEFQRAQKINPTDPRSIQFLNQCQALLGQTNR